MITEETRKKMRESALKRDNSKRVAALPRGKTHHAWTEKPNLLTLHKRIHRKFGKASNHPCTDCGKKARDWSLETKDYSDNVEDYRPRCRKCHIKKDGNSRNGVEVWKKLKRTAHGTFSKMSNPQIR